MSIFKQNNRIPAGLFILTLFFTVSCESSFQPLQENDRYYFSIYGYLDASADTQWVRVMPVRDTLFFAPRPIDATVTLEHRATGETAILNDSLFHFAHDVYAWNFWTTMDLHPAQTYQLTAQSEDGKASSVTVTLPADFPTPLVRLATDSFGSDRVYIEGIKYLADVQTTYRLFHPEVDEVFVISVPHRRDAHRLPSGKYQVLIDPDDDQKYLEDYLAGESWTTTRNNIFVAAAGPGWPDFASIDEAIIARPDGVSNIKNGVGYLAGIVSKTIPYKSCFGENDLLVPCPLEE